MKKSEEIIKTASVGLVLLIVMTSVISFSAFKRPSQSNANCVINTAAATENGNQTQLNLSYTELDSLKYLYPEYHRAYAWAR